LKQVLQEERINVVSVHGYRAAAYLALAVPRHSIGVVITEHGGIEAAGDGPVRRLRPHLYRWIENTATRRLGAHIVYVTRDLQGRCSGEHRRLSQSVIYNGIAPLDRAATTRPLEFRSDGMNLVAVGRLEPVKGLDVAIRALTLAAMPSSVRLYCVGSGPELERLTSLARELGVTARVSFLGFRDNVYDYVAHADALLMPSRHEGLPYTLLEALSLGTPVIASRVGGLAEVLTGGQTALLVEPGNPAAVAQAIQELATTPNLGEQLVRNGRALVATGFTADEMARQYRSVFDSARKISQ
jgi:glycosyltransferase involved in cell wall biosynthesis